MIQQGHMPHTIGRRLRRGGHLPLCDFRAAFPHLSPLKLFKRHLGLWGHSSVPTSEHRNMETSNTSQYHKVGTWCGHLHGRWDPELSIGILASQHGRTFHWFEPSSGQSRSLLPFTTKEVRFHWKQKRQGRRRLRDYRENRFLIPIHIVPHMFTWFAWGFDSAHWKSWLWQVFVNSRKRSRKSPTLRPMPRVGGSTNKPLRWVQRSPWISLSNIQRSTALRGPTLQDVERRICRHWDENFPTGSGGCVPQSSSLFSVDFWAFGACACPSWILLALWLPAVVHRGLIIIFDDTDLLISSAHFSADLYSLHFLAKLPQPAAWGGAGGPPWTYHQRYRKIIWLIRNYPSKDCRPLQPPCPLPLLPPPLPVQGLLPDLSMQSWCFNSCW